MTRIYTVLGAIDEAPDGVLSMHEHVPVDRGGNAAEKADAQRFATAQLASAHAQGLSMVAEVSPTRDIRALVEVSRSSGVAIVPCTGTYILSAEQQRWTRDRFRERMDREMADGIEGTGILPGVIKVAGREAALTSGETAAFQAAADVQRSSGRSICTHAVSGCAAQQRVLEASGADLSRVYFSHTEAEFGWEGRTVLEELEYLEDVARRGSCLCFNNFGNVAHTTVDNLATLLKGLAEAGFLDRILLTMDLIWDYAEGRRAILWEDINPDGPLRLYGYLLTHVLPWLRGLGFTKAEIRLMTAATPERLLRVGRPQPWS